MLKALTNFIQRQSVMAIAMLMVLLLMAVSLQNILSRGHERALEEQSSTNSSLVIALEDSTIRSLQATVGALQTIAENIPSRSPQLTNLLITRLLRGLPQLRNIDVVKAEDALECSSRVANTDVLFLPTSSGRFWGDTIQAKQLSFWPVCVPYYQQGEVAGFVIGSLNLNYYQSLFQSVSTSSREVAVFLFTGEKILGDGLDALTPNLHEQIMDRSWGEYRAKDDRGDYLESYRATSFYPLIVTLRSYDKDALAIWKHDADLVRSVFSALAVVLVLTMIMYFVFKHKRDQVQGSNHLLSMAIRSTANAIFITDPKGKIEWVNDAFTRLTGYNLKEVRGRTPRLLNSGVHERPFFQDLWDTISDGKSWRNELVNRHKTGRFISVDQTITPILDAKGEVEYFIAVHEDITVCKEAEQQVLYMAQHDDLTGLTNRRYFEQCLEDCVSNRNYGSVALLFIDLDRFKEINDTLGHDAGDALLKRTAKKLQSVIPDEALLSRLGGDEFALFLHPVHKEAQIHHLAQTIVSALSIPFEHKNTTFSVSCSVGVALAEIANIDASSLLRQADLAMYRAKQAGKNTYRFFDESMDESMQRRVTTQRNLEHALNHGGELSLQFQPQVDARTSQPIGHEVLVRWYREGEWISPAVFIPIAEDSGQIVELGRWIIEAALRQLADWREREIKVGKMAINLSAIQLSNSDVAMELLQAMEMYQIPHDAVSVEFTETTLMVRSAQLVRNLTLFRNSGIAVAIDDFGTGYCSLSYIKEMAAQYLKVDQSFVRGIGNSESDECIVTATIAMAKGLNMKVIAEGVETEHQAQYLAHHGCDYLQGYGFARPMTASDLETWLEQYSVKNTFTKLNT